MANKTIENICTRVSCREYNEKKVSIKKLEQILEAGKMAPSAMNRQIASITAVRSKSKVEQLRALSLEAANRDCMYGANTIVLVHGPRDDKFTAQDCSCVLENIFIAANALKIQSCWINQFDDLFETAKGKKIKAKLGIPEDHRIVGSAALGFAKHPEALSSKPRKDDFINIK